MRNSWTVKKALSNGRSPSAQGIGDDRDGAPRANGLGRDLEPVPSVRMRIDWYSLSP